MNETSKNILIGAGVLLVVAGCFYWLRVRNNVSDNGNGADAARIQLDEAAAAQRGITSGINDAEESVDGITGEVRNAESTANRITVNERESGELIADCQRILREVRQRGNTDTQEN